MTPENILIGFYVVCGVTIVLLLARYFRRLRRERQRSPSHQGEPRHEQSSDTQLAASQTAQLTQSEVTSKSESAVHDAASTHSPLTPGVDSPLPPLVDHNAYIFGSLTPTLAALLPESAARRQQIQKELLQAGYLQPQAYENLSALRYVGIMASLLLFGTLLILAPRETEPIWLGMLVLAPLSAWALPRLYLKNKARDRVARIERAMPDLLDMLNMCVSQGLTVPQALKRISRDLEKVYPDLSQELRIVCEQAELASLQHALENLRRRLDAPEIHSFATLIIQTERMGTSISAALTDYSDNMRETMRQRADESANQASFKLLFPTVLCLMPAVLLFLLGPAVIELNNFFEQGGSEIINSPVEITEQVRITQPGQRSAR
ncbi:MAG: type II secretion system F family protein [Planctomycetes bacterium]|nr:type II secretion system F family protein [Planctomycetota bacterium]